MDPTTIGLVSLTTLSTGLSLILGFDKLRGRPDRREITNDPLRVEGIDKPVSAIDCLRQHETLQKRLEHHEQQIDEINRQRVVDYNTIMASDANARREIHAKLNTLAQEVSGLQATMEGVTQSVSSTTKAMHEATDRFNRDIGRLEGVMQRN